MGQTLEDRPNPLPVLSPAQQQLRDGPNAPMLPPNNLGLLGGACRQALRLPKQREGSSAKGDLSAHSAA